MNKLVTKTLDRENTFTFLTNVRWLPGSTGAIRLTRLADGRYRVKATPDAWAQLAYTNTQEGEKAST
jgi:hypothetical protein